MVNEINLENYPTAYDAIRDILYMYYDLVESYGGFGHNIETGKFDPNFYLDCYLFEPEGVGYGIDVTILHEGSAVALLCKISDYRDDHYHHDDRETIPVGEFALEIKRLLSEGRLDHLPLAKEAVEAAFEERKKFDDSLKEVYKKYVIQFFERLTNSGRPI